MNRRTSHYFATVTDYRCRLPIRDVANNFCRELVLLIAKNISNLTMQVKVFSASGKMRQFITHVQIITIVGYHCCRFGKLFMRAACGLRIALFFSSQNLLPNLSRRDQDISIRMKSVDCMQYSCAIRNILKHRRSSYRNMGVALKGLERLPKLPSLPAAGCRCARITAAFRIIAATPYSLLRRE